MLRKLKVIKAAQDRGDKVAAANLVEALKHQIETHAQRVRGPESKGGDGSGVRL